MALHALVPIPPCRSCQEGPGLGFDFTMAFQPIIDVRQRSVVSYEALVRGAQGQGSAHVLAQVTPANRYAFDQACRVKAIELAARLGVACRLNINFLPNAVHRPDTCIRATLAAAERCGFPLHRIAFEVTEQERVDDKAHLKKIMQSYRHHGLGTAIDDFGAGYSGLKLLAEFQPDVVKIDMSLLRGIDTDRVRQAIVRGVVGICAALQIGVVAEGVETPAELETLQAMGVHLFQGYLFARPAVEALPAVLWP